MARFRYKAMTAAGVIVRGNITAASEAAVIAHLRSEGRYPISTVSDDRPDAWRKLRQSLSGERAFSLRSLAGVTQEMADLLQAGLELDRVLGVIVNLRDAQAFRKNFADLRTKVRDGAMLSEAMAVDGAFPRFYVSMVRAGEMAGALAPALRKLADYLTRTQAIRDSVLSALVYPVVLLVTAGLSVVFLLTFVLPSFEPLFASAGTALPLPTRIVMGISEGFRAFWWLGALLMVAGVLWIRKALQNPARKRQWHGRLIRVPLLGRLLMDIELERFERVLGTLTASGVALPTALQLSADVLWNRQIAAIIGETAKSLREGEALAAKLAQAGFFSPSTLDLIAIGEETGRLDEMLLRQADLDERRIRHQVDRLIALLVPALTIVLGIIVAGLIASMLMAILGVNELALQ